MTMIEPRLPTNSSLASHFLDVAGVRLEAMEGGAGPTILFLHPGTGMQNAGPFLAQLARLGRVLAPAHPGFHNSDLPAGISTIDDIAYVYLDLLQSLREPAIVVGASLGAWIALEIAVKSTQHIARLVLVNAVGVRFAERDTVDFADIYALPSAEMERRLYHDPARGKFDYAQMLPAELETLARNREAEARFCWSPYMHSPRLATRLHRVRVPTLVAWGESDDLALPDYGQRLAAALPDATFKTIPAAGHFPHVERPEMLASMIGQFLESQGLAHQKGLAR